MHLPLFKYYLILYLKVFPISHFQSSRVVRASFKSLVSDDQELEIVCLDHSAETAARLVRLIYFGSIHFGKNIAEIKRQVQTTSVYQFIYLYGTNATKFQDLKIHFCGEI